MSGLAFHPTSTATAVQASVPLHGNKDSLPISALISELFPLPESPIKPRTTRGRSLCSRIASTEDISTRSAITQFELIDKGCREQTYIFDPISNYGNFARF